ncbi:ankyrin repeat domain-containing protein [Paenibacillus athensensis]|uniref:Uncharacterized protein n=1 Tax=Paenibacillus athensensis TaxID=1967502 RepID=A0A4Y8PXK0_9BACL|nr:ankyrin repeat domain-containing protein [Paenibacillus athensensis]MCD1258189.1 ankyrin repeat domain-containing protein [Paenibacillus athensensis]
MSISEKANIFTIAQLGDLELFKRKFSPNDIHIKSDAGSSLLHYAIAGRNYAIANFLLKNGIEVNLTNTDGQTPLHYIGEFPDIATAQTILEKGGNLNIRDKYGNNALWTAVFNCKGKYYDMVELFMPYKPDVGTKNKAGRSPLDFAIQTGNDKLIALLQKG